MTNEEMAQAVEDGMRGCFFAGFRAGFETRSRQGDDPAAYMAEREKAWEERKRIANAIMESLMNPKANQA